MTKIQTYNSFVWPSLPISCDPYSFRTCCILQFSTLSNTEQEFDVWAVNKCERSSACVPTGKVLKRARDVEVTLTGWNTDLSAVSNQAWFFKSHSHTLPDECWRMSLMMLSVGVAGGTKYLFSHNISVSFKLCLSALSVIQSGHVRN